MQKPLKLVLMGAVWLGMLSACGGDGDGGGATNHTPVATTQSVTTDEDTAKSITLSGTDEDNDTLTYTVMSNPAHGTLSGTAPDLTYTPVVNHHGSDSFTFAVNDSNASSAAATVSITISSINDTPVANDDATTTDEDTAVDIDVMANDTDVDNDALSVKPASLSSPTHGNAAINGDGTVRYTPDANWNGTDTFTYTIQDGNGGEDNATVTVTVNSINDAPVAKATANPAKAKVGDPVTFDASSSSDIDGSITAYEWKEGATILSTAKSFTRSDLSVGEHNITLTVTDDEGATGSDSIMVVILFLKKTGQTKSYDKDGNEIDTSLARDDGHYQTGVDFNYTRDDTKEIVTDHVTGLQWQDDANASSVRKRWLTEDNYDKCTDDHNDTACYDTSDDTAATYCENLTLGGYTDWRLPTVKEIDGIVDYGRHDPAIDPTFQHTVTSDYWHHYWSSSTIKGEHSNAFSVNFNTGSSRMDNGKYHSYYVRCVRAGEQ